jgi:hypothetical protein
MTAPAHVVMFSGGVGSWAAAKRAAAAHGTSDLVLLFADTNTEDEDLYRFLGQAAANVGAPLVRVADGRTPWQVFNAERFIGNTRVPVCSRLLKVIPCRRWLAANTNPATTVHVGIDWTETHRLPAIERGYAPWPATAPLCDRPYLDKPAMLAWLRAEGIEPPRLYRLGFPHNNCGGACVRGGQAQWANLLRTMPGRYADQEAAEQAFRARVGADASILGDRASGTTRPLTLRAFRERLQRQPTLFDAQDEWGGCGCIPAPVPALAEVVA